MEGVPEYSTEGKDEGLSEGRIEGKNGSEGSEVGGGFKTVLEGRKE